MKESEFIEVRLDEIHYPMYCPMCGKKLAETLEEARSMTRHICKEIE